MIFWCNISEKNALSQSPALQKRGLWECAFCTPLYYTFSVLFWHMHWLARRKTNDKTQLSASFPWGLKNQKKQKKTTKKQKKTKDMPPMPTVSRFFFVFFVFCLFRPLWPILAYLGIYCGPLMMWKHCKRKTLQNTARKTVQNAPAHSVLFCINYTLNKQLKVEKVTQSTCWIPLTTRYYKYYNYYR